MNSRHRLTMLRSTLRDVLWGPQLLAFLPAICLGAYWFVGEGGLITVALGLPGVWGVLGGFQNPRFLSNGNSARHQITPNERIENDIETLFSKAQSDDRSVVFTLSIDDSENSNDHLDDASLADIRDQISRRLLSLLRSGDRVFLSRHLEWIIALQPGPRLDLEVAIQQASRLQSTTDTPVISNTVRHYFTATVGFRMTKPATEPSVHGVLEQSRSALKSACLSGPGSIRAFNTAEFAPRSPEVKQSSDNVVESAGSDRFVAWFQPQVSTDTGAVCGFEALARLDDPDQGILPPAAFLPALERSGQLGKLSDTMLAQGLDALKTWDEAGLQVETIGINYAAQDLGNPKLYDKIAWELDRRDVSPHRLSVEVLETVIASGADDMITRNVVRLAELGCQIDLDDFGTGHASISTLRRLPVSRLKIDRSFVARCDLDSEQQKMVATILMMSERLGLMTLAEGVETVGEHAILAQLGCRYVQGYGIAKPMPLEKTAEWVNGYNSRLARSPSIDRKTG